MIAIRVAFSMVIGIETFVDTKVKSFDMEMLRSVNAVVEETFNTTLNVAFWLQWFGAFTKNVAERLPLLDKIDVEFIITPD